MYKIRRVRWFQLQRQWLPDTTRTTTRWGQDPSRGPLRNVVVNLRPLDEAQTLQEDCIKTEGMAVRLAEPTWEAEGGLVEVSDPRLHPRSMDSFAGGVSIYGA